MTPHKALRTALKAGIVALGIAAVHGIALIPSSAGAEEPPVLRERVEVHDDLVTLGDLFENAGLASDVPVFRSPDLGTSGVVAAARVAAAANRHGLNWPNRRNLAKVTVDRPARRIGVDDVAKLTRSALAARMGADDPEMVNIQLERSSRPILMSKQIDAPPLIKRLDFNAASGRFSATVGLEDRRHGVRDRTFRGRAIEEAQIAVLMRPMRRGETIEPDDVKIVRMAKSRVSADMVADAEKLAGMAARRNLVANRPLRERDVEAPKVVKRNQHVTIVFRFGRMHLKTMGRALNDAAKGEDLRVMNLRSKTVLEAVAIGEDIVQVGGSATGSIRQGPRAIRNARR